MIEPIATPVAQTTQIAKADREFKPDEMSLDDGISTETYAQTHGVAFLADYFGVGDLYKTNEQVKNLVDDLQAKFLSKIDGDRTIYILKSMVEDLGKEFNDNPRDAGYFRLKNMSHFYDTRETMQQLKKMRSKALEDSSQLA